MDVAVSIKGMPIRLSYERWYHIVENHDEMASCYHDVLETIAAPSRRRAALENGNGWWLFTARCHGKTAL
jgi:hypothetical protein